MFKYMN